MTHHPPSAALSDAPTGEAVEPFGPDAEAAARTRRQLAALDDAVECGATMLRTIRREAEEARHVGHGGAESYERLTRSLRQCIAFQNTIDADARQTAEQRATAYARHADAEQRALVRRANEAVTAINDKLREVSSACGRGHRSDREDLLRDTRRERFDDPSVDDELNGRTYGQILAGIGKDMGMALDLSAFTVDDLAQVYGQAKPAGDDPAGEADESEIAARAKRTLGVGRMTHEKVVAFLRATPGLDDRSLRRLRAATSHDPP